MKNSFDKTKTSHNHKDSVLKMAYLDTHLGTLIAIADDEGLYLLEFMDKRGLAQEIEHLRLKKQAIIIPKSSPVLEAMTQELHAYFSGTLTAFRTPLHLLGSPFQRRVWDKLLSIPYGATRTYAAQAKAIGNPNAYRAVANANGANQIAIIIPCHRIIKSNGTLGGYTGGARRKEWLINHEKKNKAEIVYPLEKAPLCTF